MKAVVVHEPGGPEVLHVEERPIPRARPGWIVVRVRAFGLNRAELITRSGGSGDAVNLDRVFAMDEIADAHRYMEANRAAGKVVVLPPED
jgi:NADPH2:quinone reductase